MLLQRFSLEAMRHSLALANVLSWSTIVLLENASHFSIKDYKRTPKETVCKFIKLWGVLYDGSSNCNAILRYLSSPLFCSWIIIDSHLKNGLSCFRSSAKFNQMKGCVLKVMKYCADSLSVSTTEELYTRVLTAKNVLKAPLWYRPRQRHHCLVPALSSLKQTPVQGPSGKYSSRTNRVPLFAREFV